MLRLLALFFFPAIAFAQFGPLPPNANVQKDPRTGRTTIYVPPGASSGPISADRYYSYDLGNTSIRGYAPESRSAQQNAPDVGIAQQTPPGYIDPSKMRFCPNGAISCSDEARAARAATRKAAAKDRMQAEQAEPFRAVLPSETGPSGGYACVNHENGQRSCTHW